jgi:hypothetical protein
MPVGDDAQAAGYPILVGSVDIVQQGYTEINRTRDFLALVKALILSIWPVSKGGTGSSTASGARTNLGIRSGTAAPSDAVGGNADGNIYLKIL